jgi:aminopeptidase N
VRNRHSSAACIAILAIALHAGQSFAQAPDRTARAAAAELSMAQARARAARVSGVAYALRLELDADAAEFTGSVNIRFDLSNSNDDLHVDFAGGTVRAVSINGELVDAPYNGYYLSLPAAALAAGENRVAVAFSHPYSNDGSGLYRFRDPQDGRDYLYTDFEPYDQNKLFPSFDQPDLKARFSTVVTAPRDWHVISIVAAGDIVEDGDRRTWTFPESAPVSTYVYALHAGEYTVWERDGPIPLRLFARASLARYVEVEHWFTITEQGFEFFNEYFGVPYPFGKYDQIIVPDFNAGAMENVGAVTFSERFLSRGTVTRDDRRRIANVILHEMAHMWFGDLVTMDWWNGLWLNESFATFMAALAMAEGTEFSDAWEAAYRRTVGGYRADERDTTHAIELPIPDTNSAFANFDAITYNKGSAVLAQLNHLVGPEIFRRGVSRYLQRHAYGNTGIDDFLGAISEAADRDLSGWARDWLHEPGTNGVEVALECTRGQIESMTLLQTAPANWPTLRTHRTQLGLHRYEDGRFVTETLPVTYSGPRTRVQAAEGRRCPDLVYANHGDWDYVRVQMAPSILPLLDGRIGGFEDSLTRAMLWQSVWDMVLDARVSLVEFVEFALANVEGEEDDALLRQVWGSLQSALRLLIHIDPEADRFGLARADIEAAIWLYLNASAPGSDRQLFMFDSYLAGVTSRDGLERLVAMLDEGRLLPAGLDFDQDRRWSAVDTLTAADHPEHARLLANEIARDPSDLGQRRALRARAAQADVAQKRANIERLLDPGSNLTLADARSLAGGLFPIEQNRLRRQFTDFALEQLPIASRTRPPEFLSFYVGALLGTVCEQDYLDRLDGALEESAGLNAVLVHDLKDARFEVARCLRIAARQNSRG